MGQLAGDALGSQVEFRKGDSIRESFPNGIRELADGGPWNTIAGQPTDDSEMALMLARTLVECGTYDPVRVRQAYIFWLHSEPFDCGGTVYRGLTGKRNFDSQANGALMRISPLGIFGTIRDVTQVGDWAREDAQITHSHRVCQQANALFAMAIAHAIRTGCDGPNLLCEITRWADEMTVEASLCFAITKTPTAPPADYAHQQGWVLIAFHNALWQLAHAPNLEEGVVDTVMRGGDTDTNAAICGALLGAVHGLNAIPDQWREAILDCRPVAGSRHVPNPRPEVFWPVDALELAEALVKRGEVTG